MVTKILNAYGVNSGNTTILPNIGPASAKALVDGEVDAVFPPIELHSPITQGLLRNPSIRLMNLSQAEALTRLLPSVNRLVLPQGVVDLEQNIPPTDVNLIGSTNVVLVRKNLHPERVVLLAQTMLDEHGGVGIFHRAGDFSTQSDPEFPMAEEALDD